MRIQTAFCLLNPVHGGKQLFVLHPNVQRQALPCFGEYVEHFGAALRAFFGVHQDNHGEVVVHQLLADVEDVDLVFGQEFGNVVHDADAVFADNGNNGMRHGESLENVSIRRAAHLKYSPILKGIDNPNKEV